ncbi:MAG: exonuclease, partial [Ignavibacteriales bacterium]|nr:exonuclease [Ignavibacteriales bacterium]
MTFLAIDFETANRYPNSACSIGLVKVRNNDIVGKKTFLIKPPYENFENSHVHGITWDDVKNTPTFKELW